MSVVDTRNPYPDATADSLCSKCGAFVLNPNGTASICRIEMGHTPDGERVDFLITLHQPPWKSYASAQLVKGPTSVDPALEQALRQKEAQKQKRR